MYHECKQLKGELNIKYTPNGKLLVLGPYDNLNIAKQDQTNIEKLGIHKTKLTKGHNEVDVQGEIAKLRHHYHVVIGPFKHVDTDTYHRFARLNTPIELEYDKSGMMIVLGPYANNEEAERYRASVLKRLGTMNLRKRKKVKAAIQMRNELVGKPRNSIKRPRPRF